jgi:hypothetical protein
VRRLRAGEWVAGAGGVVLVATLWSAPPIIAVLLCIAALLAIALAVAQATCRSPALPVALGVVTATAGIVAVPLAAVGGGWLALAGALGVLAGGWLSLRAEGVPGEAAPHVPRRPAPPPSA